MDFDPYFQGVLTTTALLAFEHMAFYEMLGLREPDDGKNRWRVLGKFTMGVAAILAGCAVVWWGTGVADAILSPLVCAVGGGGVVILAYIGRWLYERAVEASYVRGRLHGIADHADIVEDTDGGSGEPENLQSR